MRPLSVAQIKRGHDSRAKIPREGTITREFYDDLMAGKVISRRSHKNFSTFIANLETFYGLELVPTGAGYWRLR